MENQLGYISWESFCALIRERFAKDQHQVLLKQLFHIRQSGSVSSYVDEFSQLVDKLNAYQHMSDPLYYTMKFVDGLRDDIKAVVMIQRPKDFDTAAVLAQLQEEAGEMIKKREPRRWPQNWLSSPSMQSTQAQSMVPKDSKVVPNARMEDKRPQGAPNSSTDSRLASLYAYRKAQGLCYKCGLQYAKGHKCADTIQLQMVEELWQMVPLPDTDDPEILEKEDTFELNSFLSKAAEQGVHATRTMRFVGHIAGMDVLALLDSGSSHSFVSTTVASVLPNIVELDKPVNVQIANGSCAAPAKLWTLPGP